MKEGQTIEGWVVEEEKVLLKTSVATIKSGPVKCCRSGREKEFFLFDFPDWVNVVAVTPDNKLVMIRQFRYGSRRSEIEIPGGMIDPGEDPVTAACRELQEETGYVGSAPAIIGKVCPNPAIQRNFCYTVLVRDVRKTTSRRLDEMEDIECFLQSYEEVEVLVKNGTINHGLVLNALMFCSFSFSGRR
ncbi:NUDIX hydrolase [Desulfopila sp. IMCC35008]|uniref:NUDIX hydrolase n=1 Tax=Desulfopila sp. IMCC35008 TaxID=2653858 RepID=UPI0013D2D046|nr:NUDIX hydrolase [Desulfopila sp. IMCC35008]